MTASACRKCGCELVEGGTWRPSDARRGNRICAACSRAYFRAWGKRDRARKRQPLLDAPEHGFIWLRRTIRDIGRLAKVEGVAFDLDQEKHFFDLLKRVLAGKCERTGRPLRFEDIGSPWSPQLMRRDEKGGWTVDNIQLVALVVHGTRLGLSEEDFVEVCRAVVENRPI